MEFGRFPLKGLILVIGRVKGRIIRLKWKILLNRKWFLVLLMVTRNGMFLKKCLGSRVVSRLRLKCRFGLFAVLLEMTSCPVQLNPRE